MPLMLFLALLLLLRKLLLTFSVPLFAGSFLVCGFGFCLLELERLLRFSADALPAHLPLDGALHAFGVQCGARPPGIRYRRAEAQQSPVLQQKAVYIGILRLRAEGDFAGRQRVRPLPATFHHADPERDLRKKTVSVHAVFCTNKCLLVCACKDRTTEEAGYWRTFRARTTNRGCVFHLCAYRFVTLSIRAGGRKIKVKRPRIYAL